MVVKEDLWLPFTFIRVLTMSVTVKRIVSACDFPEISEQLAVTGLLIAPLLVNTYVNCPCGEGGGRIKQIMSD